MTGLLLLIIAPGLARWVAKSHAIPHKEHHPGKLPAQAELAAGMGVNRSTVSHAYRELADLGIIYRVPGLGYFATAGSSR